MAEKEGLALPRLDFDTGSVAFPDRGHRAFLPSGEEAGPATSDTSAEIAKEGVWLLRAESGVCVVVPVDAVVRRCGTRVVGLAVLHHGDEVEFAGKPARFSEVRRVTLTAANHLVGRRCQHCHSTLEIGATVVRCPLCGEGYCDDCWTSLQDARCCSRNCAYSPGPVGESRE